MGGSYFAARLGLAAVVIAGTAILEMPEAKAITYGVEDCEELESNTGHGEIPNWPAYYNAAPTNMLPVVR